MAEKTIKFLQFWYHQSFPLPNGETGVRERIAMQGETHDITDPYDLQRGEEEGAFYTDEELKGGQHVQADPYAPAAVLEAEGLMPAAGQSATATETATIDWSKASVSDMAEFIESTGMTVNDMLQVGHENPDRINELLEAEHEASGGAPRKGVSEGLEKIAERSTE